MHLGSLPRTPKGSSTPLSRRLLPHAATRAESQESAKVSSHDRELRSVTPRSNGHVRAQERTSSCSVFSRDSSVRRTLSLEGSPSKLPNARVLQREPSTSPRVERLNRRRSSEALRTPPHVRLTHSYSPGEPSLFFLPGSSESPQEESTSDIHKALDTLILKAVTNLRHDFDNYRNEQQGVVDSLDSQLQRSLQQLASSTERALERQDSQVQALHAEIEKLSAEQSFLSPRSSTSSCMVTRSAKSRHVVDDRRQALVSMVTSESTVLRKAIDELRVQLSARAEDMSSALGAGARSHCAQEIPLNEISAWPKVGQRMTAETDAGCELTTDMRSELARQFADVRVLVETFMENERRERLRESVEIRTVLECVWRQLQRAAPLSQRPADDSDLKEGGKDINTLYELVREAAASTKLVDMQEWEQRKAEVAQTSLELQKLSVELGALKNEVAMLGVPLT